MVDENHAAFVQILVAGELPALSNFVTSCAEVSSGSFAFQLLSDLLRQEQV